MTGEAELNVFYMRPEANERMKKGNEYSWQVGERKLAPRVLACGLGPRDSLDFIAKILESYIAFVLSLSLLVFSLVLRLSSLALSSLAPRGLNWTIDKWNTGIARASVCNYCSYTISWPRAAPLEAEAEGRWNDALANCVSRGCSSVECSLWREESHCIRLSLRQQDVSIK